jgi:uncharacterized protein (DUF1330 family)
MPAYLIVYRESPIRDERELGEYHRQTRSMGRDSRLTPLVVEGAVHPLEGTPPQSVVLLEFRSVADAKAWYESPAYQAALPHRLNAADYRAVIVEGRAGRT